VSKKSAFERRERAFEAEYFSRKDAELTTKLKLVFHRKSTSKYPRRDRCDGRGLLDRLSS